MNKPPEQPVLRGPRVVLRPVTPGDLPALRALVRSPEVAPWWGTPKTDAELDDEMMFPDEGAAFVIELHGEAVGWIQYYEEAEPDYRHAGMDISLTASVQARGLGPEALRVLARWLASERGHHRFVIDPAVANERAIKAYTRAGFKPVGVMRCYERGPDGLWHDGLLMDMLAEEIPPEPSP